MISMWSSNIYQYCHGVQGRVEHQGPKDRQHRLVCCLVEASATAEQHARILILLRAIVAAVAALEAAKGSNVHESRYFLRAELAGGPLRGDELLAHHWGAAFPIVTRSQFPICTCHKPMCQKQSHKSRQWETIQ